MDEKRRHRIFVLGAGFSNPAGLPLGSELWKVVWERASRIGGRAGRFHSDVQAYQEFRRECDGIDIPTDQIDLEDLMGFLDIEFFLRLRGSDTWSDQGNETQVLVKWLISEVLTERTPQPKDIPEIYLYFARCLQPGDLILTFNYDVLLERALEWVEKGYRLFPCRYRSVDGTSAEVDSSKEEVIVLKMHGSVDWFDRRRYRDSVEAHEEWGLPAPTSDPVFGQADIVKQPLVEGPRFPSDPLLEMYRVRNIEQIYRRQLPFYVTPWLLNPSSMKVVYALQDFWRDIGRAGHLNFNMGIIGYSLPAHDEYARQALYTVVRNYQQLSWDTEFNGCRKTPLVLVDFAQDEHSRDRLRRRYAFLDRNRTTYCFNGFTKETLQHLFSE